MRLGLVVVAVVVVVVVVVVSAGCASPPPAPARAAASPPAQAHAHPKHHGQGFHHGFSGAESWSQVFDDPERDAWQKPEAVIDLLALTPTSKVADVGAGTGYFAVRLARRVPNGVVYAADVEPDMVRYLGERGARENLPQLRPVQAKPDDAALPEPVDVVLIVDTLHHIDDRAGYLTKLRESLRDGGRVFVVDFEPDAPMGPPPSLRVAPGAVMADAQRAGLRALPVTIALPNQYVLGFVR